MNIFIVMTVHKGNKSEFIEAIFIDEDNAADYRETILLGLVDMNQDQYFDVKIETYLISDYDEVEN